MRVSHVAVSSQAATEADAAQALVQSTSCHNQHGNPADPGTSEVAMKSQRGQGSVGRRQGNDVRTAEKYTCRNSSLACRQDLYRPDRWLWRRLPSASLLFSSIVLVFLSSFCAQPVSAALINFENCLPDNYRYNNNPVLLQWVPLYVDAFFDTESPAHTLRVTAYGNVTGTSTSDPLPPWDSPDWRDPKVTFGKILRDPNPNSADPKLTTLHSKVNVLTYEPWNDDFDFCNTALTNASCPLGPVFNTTV